MSKVGKHPVHLPASVKAVVSNGCVVLSASSKTVSVPVPDQVEANCSDGVISFKSLADTKQAKSLWGTVRALVNNAVKGLSEPFVKRLDLVGVGYKAALNGNTVNLQLAYSHDISVPVPEGVSVKVEKQTTIFVSSNDKQQLGAFIRKLQSYRMPEPYKGKGVIIEGQYVYRKEGKKK